MFCMSHFKGQHDCPLKHPDRHREWVLYLYTSFTRWTKHYPNSSDSPPKYFLNLSFFLYQHFGYFNIRFCNIFHYAIISYFVAYLFSNSIFSPQNLTHILLLTDGSSSNVILTLEIISLMPFEKYCFFF